MLTYVSFSRLKIQFQENLLDLFLGRFVVVSSVGATIPSVCPPFLPQSASNSCKLSTKSFLMAAHHGCQLGLYTIIMQIATFPVEKIKFALYLTRLFLELIRGMHIWNLFTKVQEKNINVLSVKKVIDQNKFSLQPLVFFFNLITLLFLLSIFSS